MTEPKIIECRIVKSGNCLEFYKYSKPIHIGFKEPNDNFRIIYKKKTNQTEITMNNIRRTRQQITRLIRCNQKELTKFLTLTFDDKIIDIGVSSDLEQANKLFNLFIQRIKRIYPNFEYICVPEFQKRGAVHYHVMCNLPDMPVKIIEDVWGYGFIKFQRVNQKNNIAFYVSKYWTKECEDKRKFRKRKILCSQNLKKPTIYDNFYTVMTILKNLPIQMKSLCEKEYETKIYTNFLGTIDYVRYRIDEGIKIFNPPEYDLQNVRF
jgi:hypothetical protein